MSIFDATGAARRGMGWSVRNVGKSDDSGGMHNVVVWVVSDPKVSNVPRILINGGSFRSV